MRSKKLYGGMICMYKILVIRAKFEFTLFVLSSTLQKNSCLAIIGSGIEANKNGTEPMEVCLTAPRGICNGIMNEESVLFIADSNSSTIRVVTLKNGHVANLVGGDSDPTVR